MMNAKLLQLSTAIVTVFCLSSSAYAKILPNLPFNKDGAEIFYSPSGYMPDGSQTFAFCLEQDLRNDYGLYYGPVAIVCNPDDPRNWDPTDENNISKYKITESCIVPKFVSYRTQYVPVLGIASAYRASTAPTTYLQDCIVRIEDFAFYNAKIESLTLPLSLNYIGRKAFYGASEFESVFFRSPIPPAMLALEGYDNAVIWEAGANNDREITNCTTPFGDTKEISPKKFYCPRGSRFIYSTHPMFRNNQEEISLEEFDVKMESPRNPQGPDGMKFVKAGNFRLEVAGSSSNQNELCIPGEVESDDYELGISIHERPYEVYGIGYKAFENSDFKNITVDENVYYIKDEAFYNSSVEVVSLGSSVKFVGDRAFANLKNLKAFYLLTPKHPLGDKLTISPTAFENVPEDAILYYDYIDKRFDPNEAPFNSFKHFEKRFLGVEDIKGAEATSFRAYAENGEILIVASEPTQCAVLSIDGRNVFSDVVEGETTIALPEGLYIVAVPGHSYKLIVK